MREVLTWQFILMTSALIFLGFEGCQSTNKAGFSECKSCQNDNIYYPIQRYTTMCPCGGR